MGIQYTTMLADADGWGSLIYLAFVALAGLASVLGKRKKSSAERKDSGPTGSRSTQAFPTAPSQDAPPPIERPQPAPTRATARPIEPPPLFPSVPPRLRQPVAVPRVSSSRPETMPFMAAPPVQSPPPARGRPARRTAPPTVEAKIPAPPRPAPSVVTPRDSAQRTRIPAEMRAVRRLLATHTGQRAAFVLAELLDSPLALRDSHLNR